MKDATHHLKHVQRKVIQSVRKETSKEKPPTVEYMFSEGEHLESRRSLKKRGK